MVRPSFLFSRHSVINNTYIFKNVYLPLFKEYFGDYRKNKIRWFSMGSRSKEKEGMDFSVYEVSNEKTNTKLPSISFESTFHGKRRALQHLKTPEEIFRKYLDLAEISEETEIMDLLKLPVNLVVPFLSKLKIQLLNSIDYLPSEMRFWIDWNTFSGYPMMLLRELVDDPVKWLVDDVSTSPDKNWWHLEFKRTFEENVRKNPVKIKSLTEYALDRWEWVTSGATTFSHAYLKSEKIKTKFGAAISLTDQELLDLVYGRVAGADVIGVFIKPDEKGFKRRLIANVPLGPYIVASHIMYIIKSFVGENPTYNKFDMSIVEHLDIIECLKGNTIAIPLDESAWDYNFSKSTWDGFNSFISEEFSSIVDVSYFEHWFNQARWSFGTDSGPWNAGMPSGLALTSYLNSWVNYIKQKTIQPTSILFFAAGDDALNIRKGEDDITLSELAHMYKSTFSADVNASKNWKARKNAEFLKTIYSTDGMTGYPARVYSSLIWAIDLRDDGSPTTRLNELCSLWKQLYDRLGKPFDEDVVSRDLALSIKNKVAGFNKNTAKLWLHSPKAFGGFGRLPYNDFVFEWKAEKVEKNVYKNVIIRVPDLIEYVGKFELIIKKEKIKMNVVFKTGPPIKMKPIENQKEWEARLNGEDLPVKGKFGRMALGIIPLPEVDFISTNMMSKFATEFNFNVFPNLSGNVNSKLILGSEVLKNFVVDRLRSFNISIML